LYSVIQISIIYSYLCAVALSFIRNFYVTRGRALWKTVRFWTGAGRLFSIHLINYCLRSRGWDNAIWRWVG